MAKAQRQTLIKKIEDERGSKLICLVLGDRKCSEPNLNLLKVMEDDMTLMLHEILENIKPVDKIDLFIYSRGGNTEVPMKVINLIRKYSQKIGAIIPYRAHSAATMLAIGCDEILMNEVSELGPIDPSITTPYNPVNPNGTRSPIETEAIVSFRDSMKSDFGLYFRPGKIGTLLAQQIHPFIIGASHRARSLSYSIVKKYLKNHTKDGIAFLMRHKIARALLRSDSHSYAINIDEAKSLKLKTITLDGDLKKHVWDLFKDYETDLKLKRIFNPHSLLGLNNSATEEFIKAVIENDTKSFEFRSKITFTKVPGQTNTINWLIEEDWVNA